MSNIRGYPYIYYLVYVKMLLIREHEVLLFTLPLYASLKYMHE